VGSGAARVPAAALDGNLAADWAAARHALLAATTDEQQAAVRLRMESLTERQRGADLERAQSAARLAEAMVERLRPFFDGLGEAIRKAAEAIRPLFGELARVGVVEEPRPLELRERALAARRNRNTGPQQRRRPPRSIGRPSARC
jgi:hypothetical protein